MRLFYSPDPVGVFGQHDYASIIGGSVFLPQLFTARRLLEMYPDDFNHVSTLLTTEQWRHLYQIHGYSIFILANPGFNPISEIERLLFDDEIIESFRGELVGLGTDPRELAWSIRQQLDWLTPDDAKALWLVLCCARRLNLNEAQYWTVTWWDIPTLQNILHSLPSWEVERHERAPRVVDAYFAATDSTRRKHRKSEPVVTEEEI
jgi:hypothetical protein